MSKNSTPPKMQKFLKDTAPLIIGEGLVMLAVILGAALLDLSGVITFKSTIATGALLGATVSNLNYVFLTLSVDRAVNNYLTLRGDREMSDEEAEKFAAENSMPIQNAIKTSFIIRTVSMLAVLVLAFITNWFNPIATAIPLLAFRPLLSLIEFVKGKVAK